MDINNGIDSKPRTRRGRRRLSDRLITLGGDRIDDFSSSKNSNIALNVRVKERENTNIKKGSLGSIFKETPTTAIKNLFVGESSHNLKDTIKRPITGLFRRSSSRANFKLGTTNENRAEKDVFVSETPICRNENAVTPNMTKSCFERVLHDVAKAPNMNVNHISAVYGLDFTNAKNTSVAKFGDIDLSLLSRFLCLEEEVNDEKIFWTWDYLFAGVSTEMRDEWAQNEEHNNDGDYEDGI